MPAYNSAASKANQASGYASLVWSNEATIHASPPADASQSISLPRDPNYPNCLSVEVEFSGAPGSFAIDLQTADTDADKYYVTKATLSAVNADFVGRLEVVDVVAKYARLQVVSLTNTVNVSAKIF